MGGILGNHQLFVGGDHHGQRSMAGLADDAAFAEAGGKVGFFIYGETEEAQVADGFAADGIGVFTNAAGEHQRIQATCGHAHGGNVFGQAVGEYFQREFGAFVAFAGSFFDFAAVVGKLGNAEQAALFVQQVGDLFDIQAGVVVQEGEHVGIDVPAAGAHHKAFERGEAHAGIAAFAAIGGGDRSTVAEVGNHEAQAFFTAAEQAGGFGGHEAVAGAVGAVAAQAVFAVELARHGVGVGVLGHGLVESGVEHHGVRHVAENAHGGADAEQVGGVV